jgi:hypothetical protein
MLNDSIQFTSWQETRLVVMIDLLAPQKFHLSHHQTPRMDDKHAVMKAERERALFAGAPERDWGTGVRHRISECVARKDARFEKREVAIPFCGMFRLRGRGGDSEGSDGKTDGDDDGENGEADERCLFVRVTAQKGDQCRLQMAFGTRAEVRQAPLGRPVSWIQKAEDFFQDGGENASEEEEKRVEDLLEAFAGEGEAEIALDSPGDDLPNTMDRWTDDEQPKMRCAHVHEIRFWKPNKVLKWRGVSLQLHTIDATADDHHIGPKPQGRVPNIFAKQPQVGCGFDLTVSVGSMVKAARE